MQGLQSYPPPPYTYLTDILLTYSGLQKYPPLEQLKTVFFYSNLLFLTVLLLDNLFLNYLIDYKLGFRT